jgi:hypothetical protein
LKKNKTVSIPKAIQKELMTIPGVGKEVSQDFYELGIRKITDLKDKDPQKLYDKLCRIQNAKVDRCMLYVMRCAVYYASHTRHDVEALKWWNWKD